jgi:hypothetical protein
MRRLAASLLCAFTLACAACGGGSGADDNGADSGGTSQDGSQTDGTLPSNGEDSGQVSPNEDSGQPSPGEDSGTPTVNEDSGLPTSNEDAGDDGGDADLDSGVDAGELHDAGTDATTTEHDAGSELDASKPVDAGNEVDSGADSGSEEKDAGVDSGVDAGPPPSETLTVTTTGWGIVTASGGSLSCPSGCVAAYPKGTEVTVTATPSSGQTFTGWSGGPCSGTSTTCAFTIEATTTVHATFSATYPSTATTVDETYDCSLSIPLGNIDEAATLSVTTQGAPPLQVPPGATFSMPLFQTVVTIPASVSCTSASGSLTILDIDATEGTTRQTVNPVTSAAPSYQFGPIALTENTPIVLSLPATPATIGTFTAGTASPIQFTPGAELTSLAANLMFTCSGISVPGTLACTVAAPANAFATTTVQQ